MPHAPLTQAFTDLQTALLDAIARPEKNLAGKEVEGNITIDGDLHVTGTIVGDGDITGNPA